MSLNWRPKGVSSGKAVWQVAQGCPVWRAYAGKAEAVGVPASPAAMKEATASAPGTSHARAPPRWGGTLFKSVEYTDVGCGKRISTPPILVLCPVANLPGNNLAALFVAGLILIKFTVSEIHVAAINERDLRLAVSFLNKHTAPQGHLALASAQSCLPAAQARVESPLLIHAWAAIFKQRSRGRLVPCQMLPFQPMKRQARRAYAINLREAGAGWRRATPQPRFSCP